MFIFLDHPRLVRGGGGGGAVRERAGGHPENQIVLISRTVKSELFPLSRNYFSVLKKKKLLEVQKAHLYKNYYTFSLLYFSPGHNSVVTTLTILTVSETKASAMYVIQTHSQRASLQELNAHT